MAVTARRPGAQASRVLGGIRRRVLVRVLRGTAVRCPVCGRSFRRFVPHRGRPHAKCPNCGALERHRLLWLALASLDDPSSVLHFAPEAWIADRLRSIARERYVGVDLGPGFDCQVDITTLPFAPESFDHIVCCHVLEHIPDDRAAMAELARVLRPGAVVIVQVPLSPADRTDEDLSLGPDERADRYGQSDHVRLYGSDIRQRLAAAGLEVAEVTGAGKERAGVGSQNRLYVCRRT